MRERIEKRNVGYYEKRKLIRGGGRKNREKARRREDKEREKKNKVSQRRGKMFSHFLIIFNNLFDQCYFESTLKKTDV